MENSEKQRYSNKYTKKAVLQPHIKKVNIFDKWKNNRCNSSSKLEIKKKRMLSYRELNIAQFDSKKNYVA